MEGVRKDTFLLSSTTPVDDTSTVFLAVAARTRIDELPGHSDYLYQVILWLNLPMSLSAVNVMILSDFFSRR